MKKPLLILFATVFGYYLYRKFLVAKNMEFFVRSLSFDGNILDPVLIVNLDAINHEKLGATIDRINGNIYLNNVFIGKIDQYLNLTIEPSTLTNVSFAISLNALNIIALIASLKQMTNSGIKISFIGDIVADTIKFPLNIKYDI